LRHRDAKRLGGLEIDDQFEFGGLLHGQIGRFLALENSAHVDTGLSRALLARGSVLMSPPERTGSGKDHMAGNA
jgi:hypothetical protein